MSFLLFHLSAPVFFASLTAPHRVLFQALYDQDHDLKKQLEALLKQEEHLQRLFDEKEEAMGGCLLSSSASGISSHTSHSTPHTPHLRITFL
jgi:hypothetical protein